MTSLFTEDEAILLKNTFNNIGENKTKGLFHGIMCVVSYFITFRKKLQLR